MVYSYVIIFSEPLCLGLKGLIVIGKHKKSISCLDEDIVGLGVKHNVLRSLGCWGIN